MEIMSLLDTNGMNRLRADFENKPDGLSLEEFVSLIILRLPDTGASDVELVAKLQDLFHQVDVNGDGTMEWEEFSGFCIEAGIAASQMSNLEITEKFVQRPYTDIVSHTSHILSIKFVPEIQRLFVCESGGFSVKVYTVHKEMRLVHEIPLSDSLLDDSNPADAGTVLCTEYVGIGRQKILAVSSSKMTITFWDATIYDLSGDSVPRYMDKHIVSKPQFKLCWASHIGSLFMTAADCKITVLHFRMIPDFSVLPLCVLRRHTDLIQDILAVPSLNLVVTCGLDSNIFVWGLAEESVPLDNRIIYKSERRGHAKGVRSLAYADSGLMLSAAFDLIVIAWDISGLSMLPLFKLKGHTSPLFGVRVLPSKQHAVTVDTAGVFKSWDIRREGSIMDSERNIQTFRLSTGAEPVSSERKSNSNNDLTPNTKAGPCAMDVTFPKGTIVVGKKRIALFDTVQLQQESHAPAACIYNPTSVTIACAVQRDVKVWDAHTGVLLCHFQGLTDMDITKLTLDFRERKFIATDQSGKVSVFNYLNGSLMKDSESSKHEGEISCCHYGTQDKVILTSGWDRTLRVYDETLPRAVASLRRVINAHSSDINSMAHSHELSLIATGSDDGQIRIWDFQFLTCEGEIKCSTGISLLQFLEPYPILLVVDRTGEISLWPVRPFATHPSLHRNTCAARLDLLSGHFKVSEDLISCLELAHPVDEPERFWVYIGTCTGSVCVFDFTDTILSLGIPVVELENRIHQRENYSPYRKLQRILARDENVDDIPNSVDMLQVDIVQPEIVSMWRAHDGSIASLQVLSDPDAVLTCGSDKMINLWRLSGERLGQLDANERKAMQMSCTTKNWTFPINMEKRRNRELHSAEKLVYAIMHGTIKKPQLKASMIKESHLGEILEQEVVMEDVTEKDNDEEDAVSDSDADESNSAEQKFESAAERAILEEQQFEDEKRVSIIEGTYGKRKTLSTLMLYEQGLQELKKNREKAEMVRRRNERRLRADHVRELNYNAGSQNKLEIEKAEKEAFSVLDSVVAGMDGAGYSQEQERSRVLGQLQGQVTWKKTQMELAREAAAEKSMIAKKNSKQQPKRKGKKKQKKKKGKKGRKKQASAAPVKKAEEIVQCESKLSLYENLQGELKRIDMKNVKKRLTEGVVDMGPSDIVKRHMEERKFAARISKRHAMSAPLLKLESKIDLLEHEERREEGNLLGGLNWKFIADKVKKELEEDLTVIAKRQHREQLLKSGKLHPLKPQLSRLSTISRRLSTLSPETKTIRLLEEEPNEDDDEGSRKRAERSAATSSRLNLAREKLEKRKKELLKESQGQREEEVSKFHEVQKIGIKRRATLSNMAIKQSFEPTKAQLRRVKHARYFGPYVRQDVAYIRSLFQSLDADGSGTIDLNEFQKEIKSTSAESGNFRSLLDNSVSLFHSIDKDDSGAIALDELARVMFSKATAHEMDDILLFLRTPPVKKRFRNTDVKPTENTAEEAKEKQKSTRNYKAEIRTLFDLYDVNKDGTLTVQEILEAMQQNSLLYGINSHESNDRGLDFQDFDDLLADLDQDKNRKLEFDECYEFFVKFWS